jgi:hypothetical protein
MFRLIQWLENIDGPSLPIVCIDVYIVGLVLVLNIQVILYIKATPTRQTLEMCISLAVVH